MLQNGLFYVLLYRSVQCALMDELTNLIELAQKGDKEAYGKIYQLFYKRILRYCQFNLYDHQKAQDVCQETFLKAWKSLPTFQFRKGGSFQAFLFRIAHNQIVDLARKKREISLGLVEEPRIGADLDEAISKGEQIKQVQSALSELRKEERQIIILRYFEEMTGAEVAKIIGKREGALRVQTHRILKKLKEILEK